MDYFSVFLAVTILVVLSLIILWLFVKDKDYRKNNKALADENYRISQEKDKYMDLASSTRVELSSANVENASLKTKNDYMQKKIDEIEDLLKKCQQDIDKLSQEKKELTAKNDSLVNQVHVLDLDKSDMKSKNDILRANVSSTEVAVAESHKRHQEEIKSLEGRFQLGFENLANKIFNEKINVFRQDSTEKLREVIKPFSDQLQDFRKKVDSSFENHAKEQGSLKDEIKRIVLANEKITLQAENLANALKGDGKFQGNWGEVMLLKILEDSGLRKNIDYRYQMPVAGVEERKQIPDVIIFLPENKHIIVDSKVSLTSYEAYYSEKQDEQLKEAHLKKFLLSVRRHIEDLEKRRYQDSADLGSPDFVLMFIPIEPAYMLAVHETAGELHDFAWRKRIVLVCPSTLFATLKTISCVWRLEMQNKNTVEIARQAGGLYDKISGFIDGMGKLGSQIRQVGDTYEDLYRKLSTGKGNVISRTQKLKDLGAKTSKSLSITGDSSEEASQSSGDASLGVTDIDTEIRDVAS